ncbi:unnamed protein product [Durusdinium trenchii]|uniref:Uncharacterized protein n=2 Tax=Durusdinium trenchii TaxID=1381693 RepID=A0ABP0K1D7_9DINO
MSELSGGGTPGASAGARTPARDPGKLHQFVGCTSWKTKAVSPGYAVFRQISSPVARNSEDFVQEKPKKRRPTWELSASRSTTLNEEYVLEGQQSMLQTSVEGNAKPRHLRSQSMPRHKTMEEEFALLPQQTEDELAISEVHSKLDRALKFLQHDVGYSLLDDALPQSGGGVRLAHDIDVVVALGAIPAPRGHRSCKVPKERPIENGDEADDILSCKPEIGKCAASFQKEIRQAVVLDCVEGIRLMHLCDYHYADVVLTLAYASVYFRSAFTSIGQKMSDYEAAHVCVLLIYLAHSFLLDETCPLRVWQQHIFKKYCNLKVLDAALYRIFKMRGFRLRVTEAEEKEALSVLLLRTNGLPVWSLGALNKRVAM